MGAFAGSALRFLTTAVYFVCFCCAAIILGIYSYFLAVLSDRGALITRDEKAIEGLSGVAVIYTIFAVILTCFLGGVRFFAFLGVVLDFCFIGAFIALAILLRDGDSSCSGVVTTPLATGPAVDGASGAGYSSPSGNQITYAVNQYHACKLNTACFAVAIVGTVFFLIALLLQIWVARHHQKEKKYGPSPANNYTSGYGKRKFWQRKSKKTDKDAELAAVNGHGSTNGNQYSTGYATDFRPSHETGYTGTTANTGSHIPPAGSKLGGHDNYQPPTGTAVDHAGYHTGPTGTSVNPYSYDNSRPANF